MSTGIVTSNPYTAQLTAEDHPESLDLVRAIVSTLYDADVILCLGVHRSPALLL
ncbi:MAG: hypothetical protein K8S94_05495 [Planctomycetia bacterium]|nr:hypothetical protein [Planctomycetia bacterium]